MNTNSNVGMTIIIYMSLVTNPMVTVHEITKRVTGRYTDSNDTEYQRIYRQLERMVREGTLYSIGTVNGGNVYLLKSRVVIAVDMQTGTGEVDEIPF